MIVHLQYDMLFALWLIATMIADRLGYQLAAIIAFGHVLLYCWLSIRSLVRVSFAKRSSTEDNIQ